MRAVRDEADAPNDDDRPRIRVVPGKGVNTDPPLPREPLPGVRRGKTIAGALSPARVLGAGTRTGAFAARAAGREVLPGRVRRPEIPARRPTLGVLASVFAEELALQILSVIGAHSGSSEVFARIADDTDEALRIFDKNGWLDDPASYHRAPPTPTDFQYDPVRHRKTDYTMLSFDSGYEPVKGLPGSDRWLAMTDNARCYARVLEHEDGRPRPWLVFLHGSQMGRPSDLSFARATHYHHLGFNVLAPVLPMHGLRQGDGPGGKALISLDWVSNVHALTQTLWDVRRCLAWIRERGATSIAVHGVSLGGYTAALLAGLDGDLDCVVAGLPASTIYRPLILAAGRSPRIERALIENDLLGDCVEAVHRVITPTAFPCLVPFENRFIYAGLADRISTPREPYLLWEHWEKPTIFWSANTHMMTARAPEVRRFVRQAVTSRAQR